MYKDNRVFILLSFRLLTFSVSIIAIEFSLKEKTSGKTDFKLINKVKK